MKVAVVTDIQRLYEKTMYLSELQLEARKKRVEIDVLVAEAPRSFTLDTKFPIYRVLKGSVLMNKIRNYDLVHVQFTLPFGFLFALFRGFHGKPVVIHTHGYDVFIVPSAGIGLRRIKIANFLSKITWKAASGIIAVCMKTKHKIANEGIPQNKIHVLYNGVDENFFRKRNNVYDARLNRIRDSGDVIFLTVGNLVPVKNHETLLIAYSRYLKEGVEHARKTKLVICGEGPLKRWLHIFANKLGITDNVIFLGQIPHSKMPELYNVVDAFLLPSLSEAHPWSLLEAMSSELPVVASNVGGIPETLDDKSLLFEPIKPTDIYKAIIYLAEDSRRRKLLGMRNRNIVLKNFTLQKHVTNLCSIYSKICEISG